MAAFELLARKAWSRRDLTARLRRRGAPPDVARAVVEELESRRYLDDAAFARWWAEARARGRRVGSVRLTQELRAKGIAGDLAAAAVASRVRRDRRSASGRWPRRADGCPRSGAVARSGSPAGSRDYLLRRGYPAGIVIERHLRRLSVSPDDADPEG